MSEPVNHSHFLAKMSTVAVQLPTWETHYKIKKVFREFNSNGPCLLLFWRRTPCSSSEEIGYNLTVQGQPFVLPKDHHSLEHYMRRCRGKKNLFVGPQAKVGNWFAGRAAQTGVADYRNNHVHHSAEAAGMRNLVLPVYYDQGALKEIVGIIELVTTSSQGSYVEYFNQFDSLLKNENLESTYLGKTIKVRYDDNIIRFGLPISAKCSDLRNEVTQRFKGLEHKTFCIVYEGTNDQRIPISSDEDLKHCIEESISAEITIIKMFITEKVHCM